MRKNKISKSEWRIMRVLWNESNMTSGEITNRLKETRNLSVTTVKTQISSLVKKGVIEANKDNRFPLYYPVVTELDCIQDAIDDIVLQFYGDNLNYASKHFEYYGVNDQTFIAALDNEVEDLYNRVLGFLEMDDTDTIKVCIHTSKQKLLSVYGKTYGPDWIKTTNIWDIVHLAPYSEFENLDPIRYFSYSMIQILISRINVPLPYYIKQGICVYLGNYMTVERVRNKVKDIYEDFDYKTLIHFHIGSDSFGEMNHTEVVYSFIDFIVDVYGKDSLLDIFYNRINFLHFIDNRKDDIVDKWKLHIKRKYIEGLK